MKLDKKAFDIANRIAKESSDRIDFTVKNPKFMSKNTIKVKRVVFHNMPDFILSIGQWASIGGWQGFLKCNGISIREVKKVVNDTMSETKFFKLEPWEG